MFNYTTKAILFKVLKLAAMGAAASLAGSAVGALAPKPPTPIQTVEPVTEPVPDAVDVEFTEVNNSQS